MYLSRVWFKKMGLHILEINFWALNGKYKYIDNLKSNLRGLYAHYAAGYDYQQKQGKKH